MLVYFCGYGNWWFIDRSGDIARFYDIYSITPSGYRSRYWDSQKQSYKTNGVFKLDDKYVIDFSRTHNKAPIENLLACDITLNTFSNMVADYTNFVKPRTPHNRQLNLTKDDVDRCFFVIDKRYEYDVIEEKEAQNPKSITETETLIIKKIACKIDTSPLTEILIPVIHQLNDNLGYTPKNSKIADYVFSEEFSHRDIRKVIEGKNKRNWHMRTKSGELFTYRSIEDCCRTTIFKKNK